METTQEKPNETVEISTSPYAVVDFFVTKR